MVPGMLQLVKLASHLDYVSDISEEVLSLGFKPHLDKEIW